MKKTYLIFVTISLGLMLTLPITFIFGLSPKTSLSKATTTVKKITKVKKIIKVVKNKKPVKKIAVKSVPKITTPSLTSLHEPVRAYLIGDIDKNEIIYGKEVDKSLPIASLTKLITAIVVLDTLPASSSLPITKTILATEGTTGGLRQDEIWDRDHLLAALLMESSNDAAAALAELMGGQKNFVKIANAKLKTLGLTRARVADAAGFDSANIFSARDLFLLSRILRDHYPQILEISRTPDLRFALPNSTFEHALTSFNGYDGLTEFLGGKTGLTSQAGQTYLGLFSIDNRNLGAIVLGAQDRFAVTNRLVSAATKKINAPFELPNYCGPQTILINVRSRGVCTRKPKSTQAYIEINLANHKLRLYDQNQLVAEYWLTHEPPLKIDFPSSGPLSIIGKDESHRDPETGTSFPFAIFLKDIWLSGLPSLPLATNPNHFIIGSRENNPPEVEAIYRFAQPDMPVYLFQ